MNATIYVTPKKDILKKLKEIGLDQQEDREGPAKEADKVAKAEDSYEGTDTEYFATIYDRDELKNMERSGSHPKSTIPPTKDQPAVEEIKKI